MGYAWLATGVLVVHVAFLVFLTVGGFLAWRWPRTIVAHVVVVAWGLGSVVVGYGCPLTRLEDWARRHAGQEGLSPDGFIDQYLTGVVYPEQSLLLAQGVVGVLVAISWAGWWRRHLATRARLVPIEGRPGRRVIP